MPILSNRTIFFICQTSLLHPKPAEITVWSEPETLIFLSRSEIDDQRYE